MAVSAGLAASVLLFASAGHGRDEPAPQNTMTVWVGGKGQSGFAEKVNNMHVEMEAKGLKFADLEIYTENGDMQGAFVTYVR